MVVGRIAGGSFSTHNELVGVVFFPEARVALGSTRRIVAVQPAVSTDRLLVHASQEARCGQRPCRNRPLRCSPSAPSHWLADFRNSPVALRDPVDACPLRCRLTAAALDGVEVFPTDVIRLERGRFRWRHCWEEVGEQ